MKRGWNRGRSGLVWMGLFGSLLCVLSLGCSADPENHPPRARDDAAQVALETKLTIAVLDNDVDPDGDPLTVTAVTAPVAGSVTIKPDGKIAFDPGAGTPTRAEHLLYTVSDGKGGFDKAMLKIEVLTEGTPVDNPVESAEIETKPGENHPPVAADDYAELEPGAPSIELDVLANDSDPDGETLTLTAVDPTSMGGAVIVDRKLVFTPAGSKVGATRFGYEIKDGRGGTAKGTVHLFVKGKWTRQWPLQSGEAIHEMTEVNGTRWLVGDRGLVIRNRDYPTEWGRLDTGVSEALRAVWAESETSVWVVGDKGTLLHYDGTSWTAQPAVTQENLLDVWGTTASDLWVVGEAGTLLRYDGKQWTKLTVATTAPLRAIWGSSRDDVWMVGDAGVVLRWDGRAVSPVEVPAHPAFYGVWGSGASDVWIVGDNKTILRWDGTSFTSVAFAFGPSTSSPPNRIGSIWGRSATDVWIAYNPDTYYGNAIYQWNGTTWSQMGASLSVQIKFLGGSSHAAWMAFHPTWGSNFGVYEWADPSWKPFLPEPPSQLIGMFCDPSSESSAEDVAIGARKALVRNNGSGWSIFDIPGSLSVTAIGGPRRSALWLGGFDGTLARVSSWGYSLDGTGTKAPSTVTSLWGSRDSDVWATGFGGFLHYWNGRVWTAVPSPTWRDLRGIGGSALDDVWAVGQGGAIIHGDGPQWTLVKSPTTEDLNAVWMRARDEGYAVGNHGTLLRWDGKSWSSIKGSLTDVDLLAIWASATDDVWTVGTQGQVLRYDGRRWSIMETPAEKTLRAVCAKPDGRLFAVGDEGTVLTYTR